MHVVDGATGEVTEKYMSPMMGVNRHLNVVPVTLASRPDWSGGSVTLEDCVLGEGKNHSNFSTLSAFVQNAGYLLMHLYSAVVLKKIAKTATYGICAVGSKCKDMGDENYAMVLQQLELPERIGGLLQLSQMFITNHTGSLDDMWRFLQRVKDKGNSSRIRGLQWEETLPGCFKCHVVCWSWVTAQPELP